MIRLSAFADEISADLNEQIAVLRSENIHFLDLRSVWNTNVLDLTDEQVTHIKKTLDAHGIGVAAIGSPISKVPIDSSFDEHLKRFERAIELAHIFQTPFLRIFSFYAPATHKPDGGDIGSIIDHRGEVIKRLRELTKRAQAAGITLLHENEKDIYGDTIARCVDVLQSCNEGYSGEGYVSEGYPHEGYPQGVPLQVAFDPANFIQCEQVPYPDAYEAVRPWLRYVHVKDARPDGSVVAAGEGAARWPELLQRLREDGYDGFLSLEPHLAAAGRYQGFSGPALFRRALQALQGMLQELGWVYR